MPIFDDVTGMPLNVNEIIGKDKSNAQLIEETYIEYHGKRDDGAHIIDVLETEVTGNER